VFPSDVLIAWTTVATPADAERLATAVVERRLAACVQVEGPIRSFYMWEGRSGHTDEFRLCLKYLPETAEALETYVMANHPYDTPEWIVVPAERVAEKYLSWARSNST
jgi:periplasmic divalent cation tolerance protein